MEVILLKNIKKLGKEDEVIKVSEGYARNYLFPNKLALIATLSNIKQSQERQKKRMQIHIKERQKSQEMANFLKEHSVAIKAKAGENGKLFGSITSKDIEKAIFDQLNMEIDKKNLNLPEQGIKSLGVTEVKVKFNEGIEGILRVNVVE